MYKILILNITGSHSKNGGKIVENVLITLTVLGSVVVILYCAFKYRQVQRDETSEGDENNMRRLTFFCDKLLFYNDKWFIEIQNI